MHEIDVSLEKIEKIIKQWRVGILTSYELAAELLMVTVELNEEIGEEVS